MFVICYVMPILLGDITWGLRLLYIYDTSLMETTWEIEKNSSIFKNHYLW